LQVRKATIRDVKSIHRLIQFYSTGNILLKRSLNELYEIVREFTVVHSGRKLLGCCALHIYDAKLGEVRSLAVSPDMKGKGYGSVLIEHMIEEAGSLGLKKIFTLTGEPEFFSKMGFREIDKDNLPQKIWKDCIFCIRFPECNEVALTLEIKSSK